MDRYSFLGSWNFLPRRTAFLPLALLVSLAVPSGAGQTQSIRFDSLPVLAAGGPEFAPRLEATSLLAVTLASSDTEVVSVVGGRLQARKPGWARLTARQPGNDQFDPAPEVVRLVWVVNRPRTLTLWGTWDPPESTRDLVLADSLRRDVVQISAKTGTIAGIRSGDQVFVVSGKPVLMDMKPFSVPNVAKLKVSCGGNSMVAFRKDGSVMDYGWHRQRFPLGTDALVPDSLNHDIVDMQILDRYSIVLKSDGTTFGIDLATRKIWETPALVHSQVAALEVSCNGDDATAEIGFLRTDGTLVSWNREAGATRMPDSLKANIRTMSGGWNFFAVVDRNGKVMEWSPTAKRANWEALPKAKLSSGVVSVAVDGEFGVALKQDGSLVPWGGFGSQLAVPDSLVGGATDVVASDACGFGVLGKLKPRLTFTLSAKTNWGEGDIEAGLELQPGRVPVFQSSNGTVAEFKEGRVLVKHVGTTTLSVSYPADSLWLPAGPITRTLTVQPRRIVVQARSATKTFGDPDPALSYTCSNCGPLDSLAGTLSRTTGEASGVYQIQRGTLAATTDHDLVFLTEAFTIQPRKILVSADSLAKTAGAPDPDLTFKVDGLLSGDKLEGSLERDLGEDPGVYPIRQGSLNAGTNYVIDYRPGSLQISGTSALGSRLPRLGSTRDVQATVRRPFVDRSLAGNGPKGLAPEGLRGRGDAVVDVLLAGSGEVDVAIFDNAGVPVCSWSGRISPAQWQSLSPLADGRRRLSMSWDLRSQAGSTVPEGVYLFRVAVRTDFGDRRETVLRIGVR